MIQSQIAFLFAFIILNQVASFSLPLDKNLPRDVIISSQLTGDQLILSVTRTKRRFLGFGFGSSMSDGDIFLVETQRGRLSFKSCTLSSHSYPTCGNDKWKLESSEINENEWKIKVSRIISNSDKSRIVNGIVKVIFNYADTDVIDPHKNKSNQSGVTELNLLESDVSSEIF